MRGPHLDGSHEKIVDFSLVRVIQPSDSDRDIQQALDNGKHVVLSPGIYHLKETATMARPNQVLLGLGFATLIAPSTSIPCIHVRTGVPGVRIAGVMLEASDQSQVSTSQNAGSLLEWGNEGQSDPGEKMNPGALVDIFCRVGGASTADREAVSVNTMMRIHSRHVVGDNLWLWRANHAVLRDGEIANYPAISPLFWHLFKLSKQ